MNHPPLPEGAVFLHEGLSFLVPKGTCFEGWCFDPNHPSDCWEYGIWAGETPEFLYAAPADSDVVRLNEIQTKQFGKVWAASDGERSCIAVSEDHAIAAIRDMQEPAKQGETPRPFGCKCTSLTHKVTGDGCDECNPREAYERALETIADLETELATLRTALGDPDGKLSVEELVGRIPNWRPIETAPKDGTEILVSSLQSGLAVVKMKKWTQGGKEEWVATEKGPFPIPHATHWQPLPEAPDVVHEPQARRSTSDKSPL